MRMRKRRKEYMSWISYRKKTARNRKPIRSNRDDGKEIRNLLIGFPLVLLAAGLVMLTVYGCVHLRDSAAEKKKQETSQASAGQPGGEAAHGNGDTIGKDGPEGTDHSDGNGGNPEGNVSDGGEGMNLVGTDSTPEPAARPSDTSPAPEPLPTPVPSTNGHEFDDEMIIAVDAGHGGNDGGSVSGNVIEKDINLAVAQELARLLKEHGGITVVQTRTTDIYLSRQERCDIANEAKCDYFVSLHCNIYEQDSSVYGLECHYNEESSEGERFAQGVTDDLKQHDDMKIRSIKPNDLTVTKNTYCPAILIEMGFLTNPAECANLADPDYQKLLAERIANAVLKAAGL